MHPDSDTIPDRIEPGPTTTVGRLPRPEHSVVSVVLMLLLSAGVLFGVDHALEETFVVVHQWDFTVPQPGDAPWTFPDSGRTQTPNGIAYEAVETGPGPQLAMDFDSSAVHRIRATISVTRVADGKPVPFVAEWYWSSPEEVAAAAGAWPFSAERGAVLDEIDRHRPELRMQDIHEHHLWKGPIARAFIGVKLPSREIGPFRIETKKIEFLE